MEFCPKCEKMLVQIPPDHYQCPQCGYVKGVKEKKNVHAKRQDPQLIVVMGPDEGFHTLPTITVSCPKCDNKKAYYSSTGIGQEDDIEILKSFQCINCGFRWSHEE